MDVPKILRSCDSARGCLRGARFFFDRFEAALRWPAGMFWRSGLRGGRLWLQYCATFLNLPRIDHGGRSAAHSSASASARGSGVFLRTGLWGLPGLMAGVVVIAVYCCVAALSGQGVSRQCYIAALAVFLWGIGRTWIDSPQNVPEEGVCYE